MDHILFIAAFPIRRYFDKKPVFVNALIH